VASIATPDARTVVMNLKEPFAGLPRLLTERRMAIVSPKALEQHNGDALAANPVGTGPFVLDKIVQGQQVELKRNDRFWGGTPKVERIIFRQIVDPTALAIAMQTGEVDLIPSASSQQVDQLRRRKGMTVQYTDPANQYYLRLNTRIAPTDNPAVRRALNYAVNRAAIAKLVGGQVAPVGGPVPAGNEMSGLGAASPYGHNPQGAKELLASAGISGPLKLKLLVPVSGPGLAQAPQIAALIQQDLKAVGITLETQFMEFTAMIAAESPGYKDDVHGSLNGWVTGADSAYFLERMFSGGQQPPRGVNRGWYNNAQVDGLFELARGEVDEAKRNEFYKLAADRIAADAPWVFLHQDRLPRIYRDRVTGLVPAASVYFDYPTIGLR
ncbi:MAG: ABC transporter substrate-binding protein, partial [Alphaproteobacteria bacterium]|nr:ABC transporter substrate-binding protein [Alphaproteobacteria bacterium]